MDGVDARLQSDRDWTDAVDAMQRRGRTSSRLRTQRSQVRVPPGVPHHFEFESLVGRLLAGARRHALGEIRGKPERWVVEPSWGKSDRAANLPDRMSRSLTLRVCAGRRNRAGHARDGVVGAGGTVSVADPAVRAVLESSVARYSAAAADLGLDDLLD